MCGQLGIPTGVPAEIALLLVGSFAIHSVPALLMGVLVIAAADVIGSTILYALVRGGSSRFRRRNGSASLPHARWRFLDRHCVATTLVVRTLPFVRVYAAIGCGLTRARLRDYLSGAIPAALLWVGTPLTLGFVLRGDVREITERYPSGAFIVCVISAVVGAIVLARGLLRRQTATVPVEPS